MNGHWLVRILFLGALASISFGLVLFDASNQTLEAPEGLDNLSPDDPPLEASDSAEDAKMEDDAEAFDGPDAKLDVHGEIFIGLGSGMLALLFVGTSLFEIGLRTKIRSRGASRLFGESMVRIRRFFFAMTIEGRHRRFD